MPTVSFSGIASGIDGDAITKALLDARRIAGVPLENKIETNDNESKALEEFNTKLLALDDMVKDFLTLAGGAVSKVATSSNSDALSAVASSNASSATTTIDIVQLARSATISYGDRFSAVDEAIAPGLSGTSQIEITIGSGEQAKTVQVDVDSETTLSSLVMSINEVASDAVQASYINAGSSSDPQYVLVFNGLKTGVEEGLLDISIPTELTGQGLFQNETNVQAQDAVLDVGGIGLVTRSSNQINDLIPGLSLELKRENAGPVSISVGTDPDKTAKKLGDTIEAINDVIRYSNENDNIERVEDDKGVKNVYGTLARTRVDDRAIDAIRRAVSAARTTIEESSVNVFADLGVTTERDGTLKFDSQKFIEAASSDPQSVDDILHAFADKLGNTSGIIAQYTGYQGTIDQAIKSNKEENEIFNERLSRLERSLAKQEEMYRRIFANLESTTSRLNSSASALSGLIAGMGGNK